MNTTAPIAVAIDGPSGAGKSTIARILANQLQFIYVDTGALYRAVGYTALRNGVSVANEDGIKGLLETLAVTLGYENGEQRVFVNGEDVSDHIRTPEVSQAASAVSAIPAVRKFLFSLQQDMARTHSVIMDGRDIGTVVLPHAQVKIFLTASAEVRAKRRFDELIAKGMDVSFEEVLEDMRVRDKRDSERAAAPLKPAEDAILVNTDDMDLEQSVAWIRSVVEEKLA